MNKIISKFGYLAVFGLLLLGFQNCSDVSFQNASGADDGGTPVVDVDDILGEPLDEDAADEIADRMDEIENNEDPTPDDPNNENNNDDGNEDENPAQVVIYDGHECGSSNSKNVKVLVCHSTSKGHHTICISENALGAHITKGHGKKHDHSDAVGSCEDIENQG